VQQSLVTVVIPAYNAADTIRRALDSVFRQAYRPIEVIVVDDASQDNTADVGRTYGRAEVRLISLAQNRGESSVNAGIEAARGDFVAFLDADDEWLEGKLEKQLAVLRANPQMSFVTCGGAFVDHQGRRLREFGLNPLPLAPDQMWRALLARTLVAKPCVVARRSAISAAGFFDPSLAVGGDQDMWIRLALVGEVGSVPEILVKAYDTPNSLTKKYAARIAEFVLPMIERHIAAQRARLSDDEVRQVLGERYTAIGRTLYTGGDAAQGLRFLLRAIAKGNRVAENFRYLLVASPPSRWLKGCLLLPRQSIRL
jgi:glycosyltransferase involved in cell wall biosynthesis